MRLTKKLEAEVLALYKDYWDAYLKGDLKTFASYLDENIVVYGTAVGEIFTNKKDAVKFYTETADQMIGKADFRNRTFKLKANGETIVIFEQSDLYVLMDGVWTFYDSARITGILEKKGNNWKLVHQHGSFPDSRTDEGDQISPDKMKAENLRLKKAIKRRTLELENKNRELEIETALEKVRAIAMGMKKPEDMLEVCQIISEQLSTLDVKEIRNVQTAVIYESKGTYFNYEFYLKLNKTFITEVDYKTHELQNLFANQMLNGAEEIFTRCFRDKDLRDWYEYQKTTDQFADPLLETADSLSYYWYSLGPVALGMSTYIPLNEQEINLFKRFRNVFELAYRRFLDIQKAEAQAREAEIQLALERVRAKSLAMQQTSELQEVVNEVVQQLLQMRIDMDGGVIIIINDEVDKDLPLWGSAGAANYVQKVTAPYLDIPIINRMISAIKKGESFLIERYTKEEKDEFMQHLFQHHPWDKMSQERKNELLSREGGYCRSMSISLHTSIAIINHHGRAFSEEDNNILKRFGNVLEQSYTRFLDLKNAEAQAREAQIEASLERVRAAAMSMMKPDDLLNVCEVLFLEFHKLGFDEMRNAMINIHNDEKETFINYDYSDEIGRSINHLTYNIHPVIERQIKQIRSSNDAFSETSFTGKDLEEWKKFRQKIGEKDDPRIYNLSALYYYFYSIGNGSIGISTFEQINKEKLVLLKRFRNVFSLSYQRYSDIALAEAQAREARIEASMEKIRSRSLAMQKPKELIEVAELLRKEMGLLGVEELETSSIYIVDKDNQHAECWYAIKDIREENKRLVRDEMTLTLTDTWVGNEMWKFYRSKEGQISIVMKGDSRKEWINDCADKSKVLQGYYGNEIPERTYHLVKFNGGYMGAASPGVISSESWDLLKRAAAVFSLAYTRFKDLQEAEASAREAQIEAALERVRSRTMGMQKSEELKGVIRVVYEQFVHLKIKVDHAGFVVDYTPRGDWHFWIADEQDIPSKITHPYFESVWANQFNEAKEKGADFFATNLNFEEKNKFYNELLSYVPELPEASKDFYLSCPGLAATTVLFDNVSLYIENFTGTPYSDEENKILLRFGQVFQQTYTRFLDLKKVEAQNQIIQADNDRKTKELEDARQLQLSMLPKELPQIPTLDIAVYMKTATEVGGDYYDFNIDDSGTLTVLVGDATGHGMMSGMMVSIMKSFFISNRRSLDLKQFFENANNSLKEMHLGRLMMPLIGVQINSEKLIATNAGMPSLLYFRNKSQKAGEFVSNNLPLGGMKETQYLLKEIRYEKGDVLLLMSDGFAELKNENNEQYGYTRVKEQFRAISHKSANEIIEELKNQSSQWLNGSEPDDDVTFVVIKIK